jgi:Flp pilus assembly protein TadD
MDDAPLTPPEETPPAAVARPPAPVPRSRLPLALLLLLALTVAAYLPLWGNGFVEFDDEIYLTNNPAVMAGLTWRGFTWAFLTTHTANWHPLTWLAHMTDVQLFGMDPRGHHAVNLALHLANAALLLLFLRGLTGRLGAPLAVALLFALHPLHVESVAWAAERKDLLSTFFGLLAALAHLGWIRRRTPPALLLAAGAYALSLLAKPMLVTLPFLLLLLDWWPLGRFQTAGRGGGWWGRARQAVGEKSLLLLLSAASSVVTYLVQQGGGAVRPGSYYPLPLRAQNAVVSLAAYLRKMVWPSDLAVFYPHPRHSLAAAAVAGAALLLAGVTLLAIIRRRRAPHLAAGWFWYLGTMVPVAGLVQVGAQAMADRYTYLPLTGVFLALVWSAGRMLPRGWREVLAGLLLAALGVVTWGQVGTWRDNESLFRHALAVTRDNWNAHINLGTTLLRQGRMEEGGRHIQAALEMRPNYGRSHGQLGVDAPEIAPPAPAGSDPTARQRSKAAEYRERGRADLVQGRLKEAAAWLAASLRMDPDDAESHHLLGETLERQGDRAGAEAELRKAVALDGGRVLSLEVLGDLLLRQGRGREAAEFYRRALERQPGDPALLGKISQADGPP